MRAPRHLSSRIFMVAAASAAVYLALAVWTGWDDLGARLRRFPAPLLAPLAALSLVNYALRFGRWQLLLSAAGARVPVGESLALFLATFLMVITPGKVGEVFKAGVLRERHNVPLARGLPVVLAERIYDVLAVVLLAAAGWAAWPSPIAGLGAGLIVVAAVPAGLLALRSARVRGFLLRQATRPRQLARLRDGLDQSLAVLGRLLATRLALAALALGALAWAAECASLWLILRALGADVGALAASFVYAAGTLIGSLVFLPGGLGGTEATMIWLLSSLGCAREVGVAATLLVRLATLWFAVLIGVVAYVTCRGALGGVSPEGSPPPGSSC